MLKDPVGSNFKNRYFSKEAVNDMNYEFIIGGCPNPDEPDADSLQIISNGQAAAASFSLASFMFHEDLDAEIYLHCEVKNLSQSRKSLFGERIG